MQRILLSDSIHLLRLDIGESMLDKLTEYCQNHSIYAGTFTGLGAASEITISYYNLAEKTYHDKSLTEDLEITSITGNIAIMDKKTIIHAHGVFGKKDYSALTGHIKKLIVSATCEIHLSVLSGEIKRSYDVLTGLNLLS